MSGVVKLTLVAALMGSVAAVVVNAIAPGVISSGLIVGAVVAGTFGMGVPRVARKLKNG